MVVGGVFGLVCLVGIVILVARRLFNPRVRATGTVGDTVTLLLLLVQLLLGLVSIYYSSHHMDGGVMLLPGPWAPHIATFRWGAAAFIAGVGWVYMTHVFLDLTLLLVA